MAESDVNPADYLPVSEYNIEEMYQKLLAYIDQMKHPYLKQLAESFFKDADFAKRFQFHSAGKKCAPWICRRTVGAYIACDTDL